MKTEIYDIIIIGAGSGGLNVAGFFSRLSLQVLLIDKKDELIGGDCLNSGCVPSKALIHIANQIQTARSADRFRNDTQAQNVDIKKIMDYIHSKQEYIRKNENPEYLRNKGIDYRSGVAQFVDEKTISMGGVLYTAKHFVLATGGMARELSVSNDNSVRQFTNETIFSIDFLPKNFVFIGGGPINCELGQAFSRLGSKVTILNSASRILEKEDEEVSKVMERQFIDEGITILHGIKIEKIEGGKVSYTTTGETMSHSVEGDAVFIGIGRVLNIEGLDLEKGGIRVNESKTRLIVDEYLRTTNKKVSVVGDVAGNYQFTHVAEMHAKVVIGNMLSPFKKKFSDKEIAWVTYTTPEVATFGIDKKTAESLGFEVLRIDFLHEDRAIVDENQKGFLNVYVDKRGHIKGGTMIANGAGELSQELILAMSAKVTLPQIFKKVYPYPVASRINRQLLGDYMSRKLTNKTIYVLRIVYKFFN